MIDITGSSQLLGEPGQIEGYHLHNYAATMPERFICLAGEAYAPEAFQHCTLPIYGIIFHPEVRNRWILERFAHL
jgi:GMP synthase (glutamine-hydrolysing)